MTGHLEVRVILLRFEDGAPRQARTLGQLLADLLGRASPAMAGSSLAPPVISASVDPLAYWDEALGVLGADEARRGARLRVQARRQAYVYAHASLRLLLAQLLGDEPAASIALAVGPKGKPRLAREESGIHFSISYRDGYAAVALGSAPLGIDIELVRDGIDMGAIASRHFMPRERDCLAAAARSDMGSHFFRLWTRKEALVKAAGVGIDGLASVSVLARVASLADDHGNLQRYCVHDLAVPADYALALAVRIDAEGNVQ